MARVRFSHTVLIFMRFNPKNTLLGIVLGGTVLSACSEDVGHGKKVVVQIDPDQIFQEYIRPKPNNIEETSLFIKCGREALEEGNFGLAEGYADSALFRYQGDATFEMAIMKLYGDVWMGRGDCVRALGFYEDSMDALYRIGLPFQTQDIEWELLSSLYNCLQEYLELEENET